MSALTLATLGHYMNWLHSQGGRCQSGIAADHEIGMVPVTKLISPSGEKYVIYPGGDQSEELSSHTIDYLDRRLNVLSPFASVPRS